MKMKVRKKLYLKAKKNIKRHMRRNIKKTKDLRTQNIQFGWMPELFLTVGDLNAERVALAINERYYREQKN